jgi:cytochrome c-type biogenesis protein CcsB
MAAGYGRSDAAVFNGAVEKYAGLLHERLPAEVRKGRFEFFFNQTKIFVHAIIIYIFAFLLALGGILTMASLPRLSESLRQSAFYLVLLGGMAHTFGLVFRMCLEARPPVTNLYSSAVFIGWGTMVLGLVLERVHRLGLGSLVASVVGFVTLIIAQNLALGGDTMEMMRAVLDTNFWLATHVVTVTLGYAATFAAGFLAVLYVLLGVFTPLLGCKLGARGLTPAPPAGAVRTVSTEPAQTEVGRALGQMIYGIVCFATLFSFVGTVLGGIWADQSWGRFWGWDPKENGALMIVLWNAVILHVRWGGLARERGIANLAIFGNVVTAFSWFGVNMLGIGLHAYGFMDAATKWLVIFIASQVAIIALGLLPIGLWRSFAGSRSDGRPAGAEPDGQTAAPAGS